MGHILSIISRDYFLFFTKEKVKWQKARPAHKKFQTVSPKLKELGAFHSWELKLAQRTKAESRKIERCGKDDSSGP